MAKPAPLKMLEVDPMAWRNIAGPGRIAAAANDEATTGWRPPPRGFWLAVVAAASLGTVYTLMAR